MHVWQKEIQNVQFELKRSTRKFNVCSKACAERSRQTLLYIEMKRRDALRSRPHLTQLILKFLKQKGPRNCLLQKKQQIRTVENVVEREKVLPDIYNQTWQCCACGARG